MLSKNIFFPIEGIYRELDYKLLLGSLILKGDMAITIAHHDLVDNLVFKSKTGIYFGKNIMRPSKINLLKKYKRNNFSIIHLDEEGAIFRGTKEHWKNILDDRLKINTLSKDDHVFTWGKFQKNHYQSKLEHNLDINISSTGTPRFDLYKNPSHVLYKDKVNEIKKNYKKIILINTNSFPTFSNLRLKDWFDERKGLIEGIPYSPKLYNRLKVFDGWSYHCNTTIAFAKLAHLISNEFPDYNVLIRPHPDEDSNLYKIVTRDIKNIKVIKNSDQVAPWILASQVVIHNRCTTGAEAFFAKKPIINYDPVSIDEAKNHILNKLGKYCDNSNDVLKELRLILNIENNETEENYLNNEDLGMLENFREDSFELLSVLISNILENKKNENLKYVSNSSIFVSELFYKLKNLIKYPIRKLFYKIKHKQYIASKVAFSGFNKLDIVDKIKKIELLTNKKIKLIFLSSRIFKIKISR